MILQGDGSITLSPAPCIAAGSPPPPQVPAEGATKCQLTLDLSWTGTYQGSAGKEDMSRRNPSYIQFWPFIGKNLMFLIKSEYTMRKVNIYFEKNMN